MRSALQKLLPDDGACGTGIDGLVDTACACVGAVFHHAFPVGVHFKDIGANLHTQFTTNAEFLIDSERHSISPPLDGIRKPRHIITNQGLLFYALSNSWANLFPKGVTKTQSTRMAKSSRLTVPSFALTGRLRKDLRSTSTFPPGNCILSRNNPHVTQKGRKLK